MSMAWKDEVGWYWKLGNDTQTKPTKPLPIYINALWINWGIIFNVVSNFFKCNSYNLLNFIFKNMFFSFFSSILTSDLIFFTRFTWRWPFCGAQLGLWWRRRVLRPKPQRFSPCPELPASCKLQVPLHSRRITPPISLGNAPTTNVRAMAVRRPSWDKTLCHSHRHMS